MSQAPFRVSKVFQANWNVFEEINLTVNRGGTSSGKTYSILQVLFLKAWEEPGITITVVGQDIPNLKKGAIRDAHRILKSSEWLREQVKWYNKTDRIFELHNGSIIEFSSYDDEQDAKNGKREYSFFNEVNGISYDIFEAIFVRTTKHTWVDFNPSSAFWLTDKGIENRSDVRTIKSTFLHNPFLDDRIVEKIKTYEPTEENIANGTANEFRWKVYGLGEYAPLEGAIFKNWSRGNFLKEIPYIWCIDWGTKDPFVLLKFGMDHSNRKIYVQQYCYEPAGLRGYEWMKSIVESYAGRDDLIVADNAEPISINQFRIDGFNMIPTFKPRITERIRWAQDYEIVVCGDSLDIENELNNYKWADKRGEVPIDDYNHAMDAKGYGVTYYKMYVLR